MPALHPFTYEEAHVTITNPSLINWPAEMPDYESLAAAVQGEVSRWNAIGMAAGVIHDGERTITTSGWSNYPAGHALVPESMFVIASISKIYTATLTMRLMEQGVLDLDTPVVTYLPDFRLSHDAVRDAVTIRHLLSHTSGFDGDRFTAYGRGDDAYDRAVSEFHTLIQWFKPGSFYSYNNAGFYLVGHIIQKLTGKSFEQVMADELFAPMNLTHTVIQPEEALNRPFAAGHIVSRTTGVSLCTSAHLPRHTNAAGGVIQSIGDLLTFAHMHLNLGEINGTRIISAESARQMQQPIIEADAEHRHYGIGWSLFQRPQYTSIGHGGAWGGHRSNLIILPDHGFAHAALTNGNVGGYAYPHVQEWVLKNTLDITVPTPEATELSPAEIAQHTGTYVRHDGEFVVETSDSGLRITLTDIDENTGEREETPRIFELEPLGGQRFRVTSPESRDAPVDFATVPDADGHEHDLLRIWGRVAKRA